MNAEADSSRARATMAVDCMISRELRTRRKGGERTDRKRWPHGWAVRRGRAGAVRPRRALCAVPARCGWLTVAAAAGSRERESFCVGAPRVSIVMFDALRSSNNSCRSLGRVGTQPTILVSSARVSHLARYELRRRCLRVSGSTLCAARCSFRRAWPAAHPHSADSVHVHVLCGHWTQAAANAADA